MSFDENGVVISSKLVFLVVNTEFLFLYQGYSKGIRLVGSMSFAIDGAKVR